jgi:hypothetical protein
MYLIYNYMNHFLKAYATYVFYNIKICLKTFYIDVILKIF